MKGQEVLYNVSRLPWLGDQQLARSQLTRECIVVCNYCYPLKGFLFLFKEGRGGGDFELYIGL